MYKIIIDSCGELSEEMKENGHFANVPLTLQVDDAEIVDDMTFDQADFLKRSLPVRRAQSQPVLPRMPICRRWIVMQTIFM